MAKIEEVRVDLKFSKEIAKDEWASISLGASATVSPNETFEMAIQEVEHQLRIEMQQAWGRMRRDKPQPRQEAEVVGDEEIEEAPQPTLEDGEFVKQPTADPSWCAVHRCKMKKYTKGGSSWYSHHVGEYDDPSGFWCKGDGAE